MKYAILPLALTVTFFNAAAAVGAEAGLRGETVCFPANKVPKLVKELSKVKADRRNVVDVRLKPRFIIKDGGFWPEKFYLAKDGELVTDLSFSRETGAVEDFIGAASARPDTDICIDDPSRADHHEDDDGLYFEMGLSPLFKTTRGTHSLAELVEGAKDGKKFYKKMLPDVMSVFMPNTDYFAIKMMDRNAMPRAFVQTDHVETEMSLVAVDDMWVIDLDDILATEANALIVRGGAYDLQPVPSPQVLKKFILKDAADE